MNEESLGQVAGSWLRGADRPAPDVHRSMRRAMAEVARTPQVRTWPPRRSVGREGPHTGSTRAGSRSALAPLVIGLASILATGVVLASGMTSPPSPAPGALATATVEDGIRWRTPRVDLAADGFSIEANDLVFTGEGATLDIRSPSRGPESLSLELTWDEHDREQRLHLHFASDRTHWWVDEIHTYDGRQQGEFIRAFGPFFRTRLGQSFEGDVRSELFRDDDGFPPASGRRVAGVLTIPAMRLTVTPETIEDIAAIPPGGGLDPQQNPFWKGEPLHCSGILSLSPGEAHERLLAAGYRVSYRLIGSTPEDFDPTKPPEGVIESASLDRYGNVNLAVDDGPDPRDPLPRCSRGN
jgi:hypothetical protein